MLTRTEYLAAWSRWHGGTDPVANRLVHGWLSATYSVARRLPGLPPLAATALGLLVAVAAVPVAALDGRWLMLAGILVGVSGPLDSLDGALAIATGRASRRGFVLDSAVDRLTEAAYAAALWMAGAPGWLAAAFGAMCWLPDYLRARAGQAGVAETGQLTVWERPSRIAMAGFTLGGAGVLPGVATVVLTAGAAAGALLGAVATAQLGVGLRRALGGPDTAIPPFPAGPSGTLSGGASASGS